MTMTRKTFEKKTFEEVMRILCEEVYEIVTYEELKEVAIDAIRSEDFDLATRILESLDYDFADYYEYDWVSSATPCALRDKEDVEHLIYDDEDDYDCDDDNCDDEEE